MINTIPQLATYIEERIGKIKDFNLEFPILAKEALAQFEPESKLDEHWITQWLCQTENPPYQNAANRFGDPPINLYISDNFYIEALIWYPSSTSIHGHGFCGAFKVLQGVSLHAQYSFNPKPHQDDVAVKEGALELTNLELLSPGMAFPIKPFEEFIHAVSHLGTPSITLVVRNPISKVPEDIFKQYQYFHQGLATLSFYREALLQRQLDLLCTHLRNNSGAFMAHLTNYLKVADLQQKIYLALNLPNRLASHNAEKEMALELVHNKLGLIMSQKVKSIFNERERFNKIWSGSHLLAGGADYVKIAIRQLAGSTEKALAQIAKQYQADKPENILNNWYHTAQQHISA